MSTFTPTTWTGKTAQTQNPKLKAAPNAPFYLLHHPFSWELVEVEGTWNWLPTFGQLYEIAGVNGVEETPHGPDSTMARMRLMDAGQVVIDREFGYLARYETVYGGYHYCLKWDVPKVIGNKVFWNTDHDGYNDWRLELIGLGIIEKPEDEVILSKISLVDRKIDRRLKLQHIPEIKKEIDGLYDLKKKMREAHDRLMGKDPSKVKKTKKGA
jgi:hypothetical protein